MNDELAEVFRIEGARARALLIRITGNIDLSQDAVQDALLVATEQWHGADGPDDPGAWLRVTARHKAIDRLRRETSRAEREGHAIRLLLASRLEAAEEDNTLALLFTCCHPALSADARVSLCLRTVCGLTTREIARSFLTAESTIGQRIHRAKRKIERAHIPYHVPAPNERPERLEAVLSVLYLVFSTGNDSLIGAPESRVYLAKDAIRLARELAVLMPEESEVLGLLALMLATHARHGARAGPDGIAVSLMEQDRSTWNATAIDEANGLVHRALALGQPVGAYTLEAAIACVHGQAPSYPKTDWVQIAGLYRLLEKARPTPVVRVNRAVAEAECRGPWAGLELIEGLEELEGWAIYWAAHAHFLSQLERKAEAVVAYRKAIGCNPGEADRRFFQARMAELDPSTESL